MLQHGRDSVHEGSEPLVPLRHPVPFVATRQTAAEEPGRSARLDTVSHSNQKQELLVSSKHLTGGEDVEDLGEDD